MARSLFAVRAVLATFLSLSLAAGPAGAQQFAASAAAARGATGSGVAGAVPVVPAGLGSVSGAPLTQGAPAAANALQSVATQPLADGVAGPAASVLEARSSPLALAQPLASAVARPGAAAAPALAGTVPGKLAPAADGEVERVGRVAVPAVDGTVGRAEAPRTLGTSGRARRQLGKVAKDWEKKDADVSPAARGEQAVEGGGNGGGRGSGLKATLKAIVSRIVGWNFDWDDNIFFMPTKIFLFKKGSGEERAVTTHEFAKIRQMIGKEGEWADYEVRKAESFRDFRDQEGRNPFLEHIREAVKDKKAIWQGPSWDAFVFALSRPETAARTTIITARGHSAEAMLEGLRFLQEQGYIKHLPKVENLHGVDHPRYKGGAANPSAAKVQVMRAVLEEMSAQELGADAPEVLDRDGKGRRALHLWGFSDDDYGNFKAALDALAEDVKAGKYANVKITVIYTGKNDPAHEPGAWVIQPDGTPRPVTTDEHGEPYVLHLEKPGEFRKPQFTALPYPVVERSARPNADAAFERQFVSNPVPAKHELLVGGDDLVARERDAVTAFIDDKRVPNRLKRIVLTRYSISDEALAKELVRAKKAGIRTVLITDLNVGMDFEFKEGQAMVTDFAKARPKDDPAGRFLDILRAGGFEIGVDIVSQPLYNHGDSLRDPLMHEKTLILVVEADPASGIERRLEFYFGTANLATNPRYNRVFKVAEPLLAEHALSHAESMIQAFKDGKTIAEIESEPPYRVYFEDESFLEMAYTNGKYNPNERLVDLLERAAREPEAFRVVEVVLSHFVMTNGQVIDALKEAMKAQADFTVTAVVDDKFAPIRGYGRAANLAGIPTVPERGRISFGFGYNLRKRIKALVYQRPAVGKDGKAVRETELEGPPTARHLWHDKTTIVYAVENGVRWAYVLTGSFNNSNNFHSAEIQVLGRLRADSPLAAALKDSIVKTAEGERDYALWLDLGILRHTLARMIGHSPIELAVEAARKIGRSLKDDPKVIAAELEKALAAGTTLVRDTIAPEAARANIEKLMALLGWYAGQGKPPLNLQRVAVAAAVLAYPDLSAYEKKVLLNSFLWEDIPDEALERQTAEAWKTLGLTEKMPPPGRR